MYLGSFAMWGGVYTSMDCLLIQYRGIDDPYNAIVAGFVTGGVLAIRGKRVCLTDKFLFRWTKLSLQISHDGRTHPGSDRGSLDCVHQYHDEIIILIDGTNAGRNASIIGKRN